ncbi:hypothetical protein GCM10027568_21000 [Humibacter soli]
MTDRPERDPQSSSETPFANPGYSQQDYEDGAAGQASATAKAAASTAEKAKPRKPGPGYTASIFWLVVGVAVFAVGLFVGVLPQLILNSHSATTTATVTGYHTYNDSGKGSCGGTGYDPVVAFTTTDGGHGSATLTNVKICAAPSNGATFTIRYDTTDPANAEVDSAQNWTFPIVALVVGLLLVLIALGMLRSTRKARRADGDHSPFHAP